MIDIITHIAIAVNVLNVAVGAVSFALLKKAHKKIAVSDNPNRLVYTHPLWILGLVMLIVSNSMRVASLPYIGVVLLSSISAMAILFNAIASVRMNGETFTRVDGVAFILIVTGTTLCMSNSNMDQVDYTHEDLLRMLFHERASGFFFAYMFLLMFISVVTLSYVLGLVKSIRSDMQKQYEPMATNRSVSDVSSCESPSKTNETQTEGAIDRCSSDQHQMPLADVIEQVLKSSETELCKLA
mmetsp:Transcript_1215/g.1508  ORF Transcript_1215/g.1508 Transcript_1215/m.1508 type:complete len:241 (+) Transcript_1215:30-752(+)